MGAELKDPENSYPTKTASGSSTDARSLKPHLVLMPAPGIRELIIGGTPYIVLYRVRDRHVIISTNWHGAQRKEL